MVKAVRGYWQMNEKKKEEKKKKKNVVKCEAEMNSDSQGAVAD